MDFEFKRNQKFKTATGARIKIYEVDIANNCVVFHENGRINKEYIDVAKRRLESGLWVVAED